MTDFSRGFTVGTYATNGLIMMLMGAMALSFGDPVMARYVVALPVGLGLLLLAWAVASGRGRGL